MKRPIILILIAFILGITVFEFVQINYTLIFFIVCLIIIFYSKFPQNTIISFIFFILALFITFMNYPNYNEVEEKVLIVEVLTSKYSNFSKVYEVLVINKDSSLYRKKLILFEKEKYDIGDILNIEGIVERTSNEYNGNFNYKNYLKSKKIFFQLKSKKIKKISHNETFKTKIIKNISKLFDLKLEEESSELLKSMILNDSNTSNELKIFDEFRELGLAHVLAISGLHLSILIKLLDLIGIYLQSSKKLYSIFIIIILILYGYIISFPVSLIRSLTMYIFGIIAIYTKNVKDNLNNLFVSMLISLIINPFYIYSVGFYLSYSALFGIFYIDKKLRLIFPNLSKILSTPISIQLAIFPFIIYFYSSISLLSVLINIIVIPIISLAVFFGFLFALTRLFIFTYIIDGIFFIISNIVKPFRVINNIFVLNLRFFNVYWIILYFIILLVFLNYQYILFKFGK